MNLQHYKALWLAIALWGSCFAGFAQNQAGQFEFGVAGSAGAASFWGDPHIKDQLSSLFAYSAGIHLGYFPFRGTSISTGFQYRTGGATTKFPWASPDGGNYDKLRYALSYFSIPFQVRKYFGQSGGFFVSGGCYYARLVDQKIDGPLPVSYYYSVSPTLPDFQKNDGGISLGWGYRKALNPRTTLSFELTSQVGMVSLLGSTSSPLKSAFFGFSFVFSRHFGLSGPQ